MPEDEKRVIHVNFHDEESNDEESNEKDVDFNVHDQQERTFPILSPFPSSSRRFPYKFSNTQSSPEYNWPYLEINNSRNMFSPLGN